MFDDSSTSLSCLLFAIEPTGTSYWACEMIAMLLIPFGADMWVYPTALRKPDWRADNSDDRAVGTGSILISSLVKEYVKIHFNHWDQH